MQSVSILAATTVTLTVTLHFSPATSGRKWDLRTYLLIASVQPLRAFWFHGKHLYAVQDTTEPRARGVSTSHLGLGSILWYGRDYGLGYSSFKGASKGSVILGVRYMLYPGPSPDLSLT